jgi:hypothetical protein
VRSGLVLGALLLAGCVARSPAQRTLEENMAALRQVRTVETGLALTCAPPDADVLLDGVLWGSCEDYAQRTIDLTGGAHEVEVRKAGCTPYRALVEAGQARAVLKVELVPSR